ncbi:tRNA (adenine57-N1/adenine58-N1)-methyltransferase [Microlunatus flavus]|uniref:tRNA (adenine(58)-N(1))-methyltransferase TrmI n=1 Tax=Microlunatus flavus TaxID=1036181 RepID=A0A1H9FKI0_9ACTN|nr:tRNA (adenine57-N1/adenine58-N1)-methyltransferase [Microlunatus flavus]
MSADQTAAGTAAVPSGVRIGPLRAGERITLTDPKGRRHSVLLAEGGTFHTTKGGVSHDELIGGPEGVVVTSVGGTAFLAMRPLLNEFTVTMPRGAAVVYPKDAAQILMACDVFPGARVVEAGAGSGALTCSLLRAVGPTGRVRSYERRDDFAAQARRNVESFFAGPHPSWDLTVGDLVESLEAESTPQEVDRAILDMLAPWECVDALAERLVPGGVLLAYVATTTQLARMVETLRVHGGFTEPEATETLLRAWHAEGLAVRPRHDMVGHTGFLVGARRMAPGFRAPARKRRPAPGAYGEDYNGPRAATPEGAAERG